MEMPIERYLKENVDDHLTITVWQEEHTFAASLRNIYNFYEMTILGTRCVLMEVIDEMPGIEIIKKHIKRIKASVDCHAVLFYKEISRYRRKSLIVNRISFVVENGQMYLPFLGLDIKITHEQVGKGVKLFSPSAQVAYLYFLYNRNEKIHATEFARKMNVTMMTASRALQDLYHTNLTTYEVGGKTGRSKQYRRISDPIYFLEGQIHLKSPVKKVVYTKKEPKGALIAGLDALAELSMINPPDYPVRAISYEQFIEQNLEVINNEDIIKDIPLVELQIWEYDPKQFSSKKHVDILSLYASLKDEHDERIEQSLEELLKWFPF